ncbi:hypothetical protein DSM112329_00799 [Paraconexibacter sp. AEG42_29]|uniref:MarR family transcriptional regulator n=1 Tax=Paraconexibacter sp. AEG42_29 TaxID=2997339 RepID=A0AAU7AQX9_9ACTN
MSTPNTDTTGPHPTAAKILDALAASPGDTAATIADRTGLGRSTVTKHLSMLERAGQAERTPGGRNGARKQPNTWTPAPAPKPAPKTPADPGTRLRPGELDALVLAHIDAIDGDQSQGPAAVAKAIGRSSGAVANCMARLARAGTLKQTSDKPRRYTAGPR